METSLRILNFITDDKFLDTVIKNHDLVNEHTINHYVLILNKNENKDNYIFKYIKNSHRIKLLYKNEIFEFIKQKSINSIILHSLYSIPTEIIPEIDKTIPILWVAWGYDIYQLPTGKPLIEIENLFLPLTSKYYDDSQKKRRGIIKNILARARLCIIKKGFYQTKQIRQVRAALNRINFFSGIIDMEYQLMKKNPYFNAEESVYVYSPLDYEKKMSYPKGNNILLGNSGNPTNNHFDILTILCKRAITVPQIITPLNYGGNENYVLFITDFGKQHFGASFNPLTKFLERDAYRDLISSCSSVIIGTMRQQAMGNISLAIENGSKVFLYKDSVLYKYFKSKGYKVFTIDDELTNETVLTPLSESDANYNFKIHRELTLKKWNPMALQQIYNQFRQYILKNTF